MRTAPRRGFTLIELLTVIAIIAVLAALLLPVFSRVKENGRRTTCVSNMHALQVAMSLYKDDNDAYPCMLLGPAEQANGLPWAPGDSAEPVGADKIQHGFLYPAYVRDVSKFQCPNNQIKNRSLATTAVYPETSPWRAVLNGGIPLLGSLGCYRDLPAALRVRPLYFYAMDSYDITSVIEADGTAGVGYQVAYSKDWNAVEPRGIDPRLDAPNQLKWRNPPLDKTTMTWCNQHVTTNQGDKTPLMLASGSARTLDFKDVANKGWNIAR